MKKYHSAPFSNYNQDLRGAKILHSARHDCLQARTPMRARGRGSSPLTHFQRIHALCGALLLKCELLRDASELLQVPRWSASSARSTVMALRKRLVKQESKREFNEAELTDLRTAFGLLDRNRDGHVTAGELQFMLQNLGIHLKDEFVQQLLQAASHKEDGLINETEFLQWVARIQALQEKGSEDIDDVTKDLIAAFRVFDRDGNGYISKDELKTAMDMIGEPVTDVELNEMLTMADIDRDGRINYEEFARLLL